MLNDSQRRELESIERAAARVADHAEQAARSASDEVAVLATLVAELAKVIRQLERPREDDRSESADQG